MKIIKYSPKWQWHFIFARVALLFFAFGRWIRPMWNGTTDPNGGRNPTADAPRAIPVSILRIRKSHFAQTRSGNNGIFFVSWEFICNGAKCGNTHNTAEKICYCELECRVFPFPFCRGWGAILVHRTILSRKSRATWDRYRFYGEMNRISKRW